MEELSEGSSRCLGEVIAEILAREPDVLGHCSQRAVFVAEVVSDEVLLALPIVPMHGDQSECRALSEDYVPVKDERENPFAVLAQLKQK
jgi:uncharacterized metal-binding protein YceD (DUF177 family)